MPGQPPGPLVLGVIAVLEHEEELTRAEICRAMGVDRFLGSSVISRMRRATKMLPKRIYVVRWVYEDDDGRYYPRAVFALGDKPDARKPKPKPNKECTAKYRARNRGRASSVFNWAQPLYKRSTTV